MGQPPERQLVLAMEAGDQSALGAIYDQCGSLVYQMALRVLRDPQRAEALTQDLFISVWAGREAFPADRESIAAWLVRRARERAVALAIAAAAAAPFSGP